MQRKNQSLINRHILFLLISHIKEIYIYIEEIDRQETNQRHLEMDKYSYMNREKKKKKMKCLFTLHEKLER
jgi:hypothetical protein